MSTVRKSPPQPAPSLISGTLKVRKPAAAEAEAEVPAVGAPARTPQSEERSNDQRRKAEADGVERPRGDRTGGERGRERTSGRPSERPLERPRSQVSRGEGATNPARRGEGHTNQPRRGEGPTNERTPASRGRSPVKGPRAAGDAGERSERPGRVRGAADNADASAHRRAYENRADAGADSVRSIAAASASLPVSGAAAAEPPSGVRLSKIMAERGICSRREADEFIERGWVFVDGKRVSALGIRIDPDARIDLAPEAARTQGQRVTILLHKPVGYVSGQPEPGYTPAASLIGADNQFDRESAQRFHGSHLMNLAPAGRLDIDSTGLLVLTQDGRIARRLIGEDSKVDKEYLVRVEGQLDAEGLALLNHGLELDGVRLRPAKVEWINDDQLRFELREGRKRQIRRMCELVGLNVLGLKRVRIGQIKLSDLPLGEWRFLREDESF